ncbi:MAG: hypothetical protein GX445_08250 [Elusimicrobia bacterium]|nr:hypothetical protein [Elusimicrobiota bacterium]
MGSDRDNRIKQQLEILNDEIGPVSRTLIDYSAKTNRLFNNVLNSIKVEPKDIVQISDETGLDSKKVLWILAGLVKYGKAEQISNKSGYMKYRAKQEK